MFENLENFMDVYFTKWVNALKDHEEEYVPDKDGNWTNFHMRKILYPLAEALRPEEGDEAYKTMACSDCLHLDKDCKKLKQKYTTPCRYGETWSQEYYRVDLGLYRYPNAENGLWTPDYLIEHENEHFQVVEENGNFKIKKKGWFGEFVKLLLINCSSYGVRVVISYSDFTSSGGEESVETYKEFLLSVLENETVRPSLCEKPILVLLGPSISAVKKAHADFYFMMFEKNGQKWKPESGFSNKADVVEIFRKLKEALPKRG